MKKILNKYYWSKAQKAEKQAWISLWQPSSSKSRQKMEKDEITKGEFIIKKMGDSLDVEPRTQWKNSSVLDVACGPVSYIARHKIGRVRDGVDPLKYPSWVYDNYRALDFNVHLMPFEKLKNCRYDILFFYNALQHFGDLPAVVKKCRELLSPNGQVFIAEYLNIPKDAAHIQLLTAEVMDNLFKNGGFKVESMVQAVRLPGLVERGGGQPIDLYTAKASLGSKSQ
jgi:SAM-dependent methyltransferase